MGRMNYCGEEHSNSAPPTEKSKHGKGSSTAKRDEKSKDVEDPKAETSVGTLDANGFLEALALKHGFAAEEYSKTRSSREWKEFIVASAGRIFQQAGTDRGSSSE